MRAPLLLGVLGGLSVVPGPGLAQEAAPEEPPPPPPCSAPEFRQLDFWVGTWDLTWGEDGRGTNVIERAYDDCVILERFDGGDFEGMSMSTWVPAIGAWRQTWVDNQGGYLEFVGGWEDDRMVLSRTTTRDGKEISQRMVFHDIGENSLLWDWESSEDGEKSWKTLWQIRYRRRG